MTNTNLNGSSGIHHPSLEPKKETTNLEDDIWEDIERERPSSQGSVRSVSTTPRRRAAGSTRTVFVAASSTPRRAVVNRQQRARSQPATVQAEVDYYPQESEPESDCHQPSMSVQLQRQTKPYSRSIFIYFVSVVADAFQIHRPLFSIALALCMAYLVFTPIISFTGSLTSPLCSIPILHKAIPFCSWDDGIGRAMSAKWADYPTLMDLQTATFEQLLDESAGGSVLALEVKKAEMATSDLATLIRVSDLKSRDSLARVLVSFVDDAKKTSRGLQTLSSKINGAVDTVLAVNDYALNMIEAASTPKSMSSRLLTPFSRFAPRDPTKEVVTEAFVASMSSLSRAMERCILEAQVSLADLDRLEEHLSLLHEMVAREDIAVHLEKSELLSELWSLLGGNRRKLRGIDNHLILLKGIGGYRRRALAHVVATIQALGALSADMEDLRSRVAAPDIVGDKIPVDVHIKSIKGGLERLKNGQTRSRERQDESIKRILGG